MLCRMKNGEFEVQVTFLFPGELVEVRAMEGEALVEYPDGTKRVYTRETVDAIYVKVA